MVTFPELMEHLQLLIQVWKSRARRKFQDAEQADTDHAKRFIEHGAMCYLNAAEELEGMLARQVTQAQER